MSWYRAGSVTVGNGSNVVTGAGTDFVANVAVGDAFIGQDGRSYEVSQIISATELRLTTTYQAAGGGGQAYAIQPTQSYIRDLALQAGSLLSTFAGVRDGVGQGIFAAGTAATPGIRNVADQDTGLRWVSDNVLALVSGGVDKLTVQASGNLLLDGPRTIVANGVGTAMLANPADAGAVAITAGSTAGYVTGWTANGGGGAAPNTLIAVTGSAERARLDANGNFGIGTTSPAKRFAVSNGGATGFEVDPLGQANNVLLLAYNRSSNAYVQMSYYATPHVFYNGTSGAEVFRTDSSANVLIGTTSGSNHLIAKSVAEGNAILQIVASASGTRVGQFNGTAQEGFNGARAALWLGKDSTTGRSGGFAGTVNASGADYAEYMVKAAGCGIIAKGDVCGVDRDGKLTKTWADAVSFVVKSTDPSLVGGDTWAAHLPPKPELPGAEPVPPIQPGAAPVAPIEPGPEPTEEGAVYVEWLQARFAFAVAERDYALALAEWQDATDAYPAARAAYEADHAAWADAKAAYARELPAWEAQLEAARVCVDRIAFCGQVPCNVSGDFAVGDYIIPVQDGDGIKAVAVKDDDSLTDRQYRRRIGKVWAIRGGRAWIDVQHG